AWSRISGSWAWWTRGSGFPASLFWPLHRPLLKASSERPGRAVGAFFISGVPISVNNVIGE
ncbi:hypothetical protein, partial [Photobacterium sp. DNB22_13_2]